MEEIATSRHLSEDQPRLSKRIFLLYLPPKLLSAGSAGKEGLKEPRLQLPRLREPRLREPRLREPRLRGTQVRDGQK